MQVSNNGYSGQLFTVRRGGNCNNSPDVSALESQMNAAKSQQSGAKSQQSGLQGQITSAEQGINQINTSISTITSQMGAYQSAVASGAQALSSAQAMPDQVQTGTDEQGNPVMGPNPEKAAAVAAAQAAYTQALASLEAATSELSAAQSSLSQTQEALYTLQSEDTELEGQVTELEETIATLASQIEQAKAAAQAPKADETNAPGSENGLNEAQNGEQTSDKPTVEQTMLAEMNSELEKLKGELEAEANAKIGFGMAWDGIKGVFGGGTKGELNANKELQTKLDELMKSPNPDPKKIDKLYQEIFQKKPDKKAIQESIDVSCNIMQNKEQQQAIADKLMGQVNALSNDFNTAVKEQGLLSKVIGAVNNYTGVGTTEDMTKAQMEQLKKTASQLQNAKTPEEFAAAYQSITGEALSQKSLDELMGDESKVNNTKAAEHAISYQETNENIKNTAIAVGVGMLTAASGGVLGAVAIGAAVTVGVNAFDSATRANGEGFIANTLDYMQHDMIKDAFVGGFNGLTGKLGNMASDKMVETLATKQLGAAGITHLTEEAITKAGGSAISQAAKEAAVGEAMKDALKTGNRILTEFIEGAVDGGLSSAGEYLFDAAAGENGNFTNADGKLFNDDGSLALGSNFKENFDARDMFHQVATATIMGGTMSAVEAESVNLIKKGIDKVKGNSDAPHNPTGPDNNSNNTSGADSSHNPSGPENAGGNNSNTPDVHEANSSNPDSVHNNNGTNNTNGTNGTNGNTGANNANGTNNTNNANNANGANGANGNAGSESKSLDEMISDYLDNVLEETVGNVEEYLVDAAAGENGDFTNSAGKFINDDGTLAFITNFRENFDLDELVGEAAGSTVSSGFGEIDLGGSTTHHSTNSGSSHTGNNNNNNNTHHTQHHHHANA